MKVTTFLPMVLAAYLLPSITVGESVLAEGSALSVLDITNTSTSRSPAISIPDAVIEKIQDKAAKSHPDDFSTQLYVIENQKKAYLKLANLKPPKDVPKSVFKKVVKRATKQHHSDYSTQFYVINNQLDAYQELKDFRPPSNVPKSVFKGIVRKAARSHSDDYSTLRYVINNQIEAYVKMRSR